MTQTPASALRSEPGAPGTKGGEWGWGTGVRKGAFHFDEERQHRDQQLCCDEITSCYLSECKNKFTMASNQNGKKSNKNDEISREYGGCLCKLGVGKTF